MPRRAQPSTILDTSDFVGPGFAIAVDGDDDGTQRGAAKGWSSGSCARPGLSPGGPPATGSTGALSRFNVRSWMAGTYAADGFVVWAETDRTRERSWVWPRQVSRATTANVGLALVCDEVNKEQPNKLGLASNSSSMQSSAMS